MARRGRRRQQAGFVSSFFVLVHEERSGVRVARSVCRENSAVRSRTAVSFARARAHVVISNARLGAQGAFLLPSPRMERAALGASASGFSRGAAGQLRALRAQAPPPQHRRTAVIVEVSGAAERARWDAGWAQAARLAAAHPPLPGQEAVGDAAHQPGHRQGDRGEDAREDGRQGEGDLGRRPRDGVGDCGGALFVSLPAPACAARLPPALAAPCALGGTAAVAPPGRAAAAADALAPRSFARRAW